MRFLNLDLEQFQIITVLTKIFKKQTNKQTNNSIN